MRRSLSTMAVMLAVNLLELAPAASAGLLNVSGRLPVGTGDNVMIAGFIITGTAPRKVIIRGLGPSLASFGLSGTLADPVLELHSPDGSVILNDNWQTSQAPAIRSTGLAPGNSLESAIVAELSPGTYTAVLRGADDATGIGLIEVYDLSQTLTSGLVNVSIRGRVESDDNVLIAGTIVGGEESVPIVVRALGPSLGSAGVSDYLPDPTLELHDSNGQLIAFNDNWKSSQQADLTLSHLAPADDRESALDLILPPGAYTAVVRGHDEVGGVALAEIYQVPPRSYDHVFVIVMENVQLTDVIGSENAPYINDSLLPVGTLYSESYALVHPSLPNYLALFAGSTFAVTNDNCINDNPPNGPFDAPSLYSVLVKAGKTVRGYMEDLPFAGYSGCQFGLYVQRHDPLMYFHSGTENDVPYSASVVYQGPYPADTAWPNLVFITPNLIHDMHNGATVATHVANGDKWLSQHLPPLLTYAQTHNGLIVLTADESEENADQHIPTLLLGSRIAGGVSNSEPITHFNVTKTISDNFGVPPLGDTAASLPLIPLP